MACEEAPALLAALKERAEEAHASERAARAAEEAAAQERAAAEAEAAARRAAEEALEGIRRQLLDAGLGADGVMPRQEEVKQKVCPGGERRLSARTRLPTCPPPRLRAPRERGAAPRPSKPTAATKQHPRAPSTPPHRASQRSSGRSSPPAASAPWPRASGGASRTSGAPPATGRTWAMSGGR